MNSIKEAMAEALMRRKKSPKPDAPQNNDQEMEQAKKQDLAPSVKDHAKLEIDINVGHQPESMPNSPEENMPGEPSLDVLLGKEPSPHELDRIKNNKPRSLMERAQQNLLNKKG